MAHKSNYRKVAAQLDFKKKQALEKVGLFVEGESVLRCPVGQYPNSARTGGNLRGSIGHKTKGDTVWIGTNVEYAPYVFLGTKYQVPQPTIRPAVFENKRKIEGIVEEAYR